MFIISFTLTLKRLFKKKVQSNIKKNIKRFGQPNKLYRTTVALHYHEFLQKTSKMEVV
jgi:hypothetical protein